MGIRSKTKVNEVSTSLSDMKVTIAGRPKVGKTSLFYEILKREGGLDTGLLMAFEKGYGFLPDINVVDIETWQEFVEYVDDLVEDAEGFKFLGLDTVDIAGKLCQEYVLKKQSAKDGKRYEALADLPYGKAYELLEAEFSKQIGRLEASGFGLFFITHDKDRQVEEKNGMKYDKVQMSVSGRVGDYIKNSSDFIIFIDIEKEKVKDGKTQIIQESRKMRFRGDGTTEAGGRIQELPEVIDYDVDNFLATIEQAIVTQTEKMKHVKKDVEKSEKTKEKKPKIKKEKVEETKTVDKSEELASVKSSISEFVSSLEVSEKKEWAQDFKETLGTMNFNDSDDLDALKSLLSKMK